jgi:hypothetical protein
MKQSARLFYRVTRPHGNHVPPSNRRVYLCGGFELLQEATIHVPTL